MPQQLNPNWRRAVALIFVKNTFLRQIKLVYEIKSSNSISCVNFFPADKILKSKYVQVVR